MRQAAFVSFMSAVARNQPMRTVRGFFIRAGSFGLGGTARIMQRFAFRAVASLWLAVSRFSSALVKLQLRQQARGPFVSSWLSPKLSSARVLSRVVQASAPGCGSFGSLSCRHALSSRFVNPHQAPALFVSRRAALSLRHGCRVASSLRLHRCRLGA